MATKKPKKKTLIKPRRAPTHEARLRADLEMSSALNRLSVAVEALRSEFNVLRGNVDAQREAIERLDLTVAGALAYLAKGQPIHPTLYPGPQDGGVPSEVATKAYDKANPSAAVMAQTAMSAHQPTDAELLS
jgi:hypothetical protein